MKADEARERMQEIQRIMERTTLFTQLPGWAAICGGIMVLTGCAISYAMLPSFDFGEILIKLSTIGQGVFCVMWFMIGVLGVVFEVVETARRAKRMNLSPTARSARVAALSLTPSIIVAMVLTVKFLIPVQPKAEEIQYIVPVWMMLYGTGVYTAGLFSLRAPRILGLTFTGLGVVALLAFPEYGVVSAAVSFGLLHIIFGLYILGKQRQERLP
jgi:hypothetical protein